MRLPIDRARTPTAHSSRVGSRHVLPGAAPTEPRERHLTRWVGFHPATTRPATARPGKAATSTSSGAPRPFRSAADVHDPDLDDQPLTPAWALRELARIRAVAIEAGERRIELVTRRSLLQAQVLDAFGVDTVDWSRARIA